MLTDNNSNRVMEVDFILRNLFIFAPKPLSRYKLRLVVRDHSEQERIAREKQYYNFRFVLESALRQGQQDGEIYLLQKEQKQFGAKEYKEIGIGKLDLSMCRQRQNYSKDNQLIHGLIYAINDGKSEKIIAKFSYKMVRRKKVDNEQKNQFLQVQPITVSRRRQKLPTITFRQSIIDKNVEIENKLKDLTRQMDETLKRDKQSGQKMKCLQETIVETLREFAPFQHKVYTYKYSEKMENLMQNSIGRSQLYRISIKTIKICNYDYKKSQQLALMSTKTPKLYDQTESKAHILMSFSQIFQQLHFRRKIIEIFVPVLFNQTMNFQQNISFYLPKTSNRILVEVINLSKNDKEVLFGYIQFGESFNKIIEIFNTDNQQIGFIVALIDDKKCIDESFMDEYRFQKYEHNKLITQFDAKPAFQNKNSSRINKSRRKSYATSSRLVQLDSARQAQVNSQQKKRYRFRKMLNPQFFAIKTQQNEPSLSRSRILLPKQSQVISESRVKQYSIGSSPQRGRVRLLNYSNSRRRIEIHQKLYLKSIALSFDTQSFTEIRKVMLRLEMNNQIHLKKIHVSRSQQLQWRDTNLNFETSITNDSKLKIGCYLKEIKGGESDYRQICSCSVSTDQMKNFSDDQCSLFLTNSNKILGKLLIKFQLNQSRVIQTVRQDQQSRVIPENKRNLKTQQYQLSLDGSVVCPFGKSRIKRNQLNGKSSSRKSQINSKIDDF